MTDNRLSTEEYKAEIRRLYTSGMNAAEVAQQLGKSHGSVMYHLKRMAIARPMKLIDWPIEDMRRWYEEDGLTLQEIADRLGQNQKVVNKVAKKNGFRMRRRGPPRGESHPDWKGGKTVDKSGYVLVKCHDHPHANHLGYVREHRLVMERFLGRFLLPTEVVHHKDDNRQNNDPSNLELFDTNADHLAETLKGKRPQWTEQGRQRMKDGHDRWRQSLASNATKSQHTERDGQASP